MKIAIVFILLSVPVVYFSRRTLLKFTSHGFYRFISWECIAWLTATSVWVWFDKPFSPPQLISWSCLIYSILVLILGVIQLRKMGKSSKERTDDTLYTFEKTTELVDTGIYKYIRHPLYSSLIFLTFGILFKNVNAINLILAFISTICLFFTARFDEKECVTYFGDKYKEYMTRSKMFVPSIW